MSYIKWFNCLSLDELLLSKHDLTTNASCEIFTNVALFQRQHIVTGLYEPTSEESEWKLDSELAEEISKELQEKAKVADASEKKEDSTAKESSWVIGNPGVLITVTICNHVLFAHISTFQGSWNTSILVDRFKKRSHDCRNDTTMWWTNFNAFNRY